MKKIIIALALLALPGLSLAAGGGYPLEKAPIDLHDKASLQKGAKLYVNYCMGCHSLEYQRYNRLARDIGLTDEQINLMTELTRALRQQNKGRRGNPKSTPTPERQELVFKRVAQFLK